MFLCIFVLYIWFFVHYFLLLYRCFWKLSKFRHQLILKEFHSISSMLSFLSSVKAWSMFILIYNYINSFYLFINRIIDSQLREMEGAWLATKWVLVRDYIFSFILYSYGFFIAGKTIQAIAVCSYYMDEWPALIITPSSLIMQWAEVLY